MDAKLNCSCRKHIYARIESSRLYCTHFEDNVPIEAVPVQVMSCAVAAVDACRLVFAAIVLEYFCDRHMGDQFNVYYSMCHAAQ